MTLKNTLDNARADILAGRYPKAVLADNTKTGVSILDNVPQLTCYGACPIRRKCYDVKILKLRPNVARARALRHFMIEHVPSQYIEAAKREITKRKIDKVRIYGGGDFTPAHVRIVEALCNELPHVTFYMISKTIRDHVLLAIRLLTLPNFFLNISECQDFTFGPEWDDLRSHPRVNSVYTLLPDDTDYDTARARDIVFNVSKAEKAITLYKEKGLPLCPCDAHDIPSAGACGKCNLCATKGGVKGNINSESRS